MVDGDQDLWVRLAPGNDLVVLGTIREPFLHFDDAGVYANLRSPTAQSDLFGIVSSRPTSLNPGARPTWRKVSNTGTYLWHDHRLHALALLAGGHEGRLGGWTIPLRLNGRQGQITGELFSVPAPSRWFWLVLTALIAVSPALFLRRRASFSRIALPTLAALTTAAVLVARAGRDLYGRPDVMTARYVSLGIAVGLGIVALDRLLRGGEETKPFVAMIVGVVGVVEGLTLLPTFWHGLVLAALPGSVERLCGALALGAGTASLILCFAGARAEPLSDASPLPERSPPSV
ncbi:MAG: hypothetical protein QOH48_2060 [Actinomycetota bacterium]|nr:hypothetical protein [Actinomycetota bacterium]